MGKMNVNFATILHLAEWYCEQYKERELCLSQEQNDAFFRDFVRQYLCVLHWGREPKPIIRTDIPLF